LIAVASDRGQMQVGGAITPSRRRIGRVPHAKGRSARLVNARVRCCEATALPSDAFAFDRPAKRVPFRKACGPARNRIKGLLARRRLDPRRGGQRPSFRLKGRCRARRSTADHLSTDWRRDDLIADADMKRGFGRRASGIIRWLRRPFGCGGGFARYPAVGSQGILRWVHKVSCGGGHTLRCQRQPEIP
jgi:hypothetical protein